MRAHVVACVVVVFVYLPSSVARAVEQPAPRHWLDAPTLPPPQRSPGLAALRPGPFGFVSALLFNVAATTLLTGIWIGTVVRTSTIEGAATGLALFSAGSFVIQPLASSAFTTWCRRLPDGADPWWRVLGASLLVRALLGGVTVFNAYTGFGALPLVAVSLVALAVVPQAVEWVVAGGWEPATVPEQRP